MIFPSLRSPLKFVQLACFRIYGARYPDWKTESQDAPKRPSARSTAP
jgi:hypothetical protein